MRHLMLNARIPAQRAETVYDSVTQWDHYPRLAPHVNAVSVPTPHPTPQGRSSWELHFRSGLLRWTEREEFARDRLEVAFEQTDGDFDSFTGTWQLRQDGEDVRLAFRARFDFGIPSLEGILDPIAERVIKETVAWAVKGLFPSAVVSADADPAPTAPGATV